jgi:hypothetical protein
MNARAVLFGTLLGGLLVLTGCQATEAPPADQPDTIVTVDGNSVLRTIAPGDIFGANLGAWVLDTKLGTTTQNLLRGLRPSVARFPGGNISNNYCWVEQKVSGNDHLVWEDWDWGIDVDEFLAFIEAVDCVPMFSLNPFDHTIDGHLHLAAEEAADLAGLFVGEGFAGAFYEVGNENDGSWNPMLTVNEYTDRFVHLAMAVKMVDPTARLMGPVGSGTSSWITDFLDRLALLGATNLLDLVSFHRYGGWISNGNTEGIDLDDPQEYADDLEAIRSALDARGLGRIKIAVTELNAAIWDTGCTRDQFTIKQALWLADALGVSLLGADMANVWIHLHPGADPHALIGSEATPPAPTRNYWPIALAARTLSSTVPAETVEVLGVTREVGDTVMTAYVTRKADGTHGVLLVNKSDRAYDVAVNLPFYPQTVAARRISQTEYDAGTGPAQVSARIEARRIRTAVPGRSILGLEVR